jgi:hypothetical protein
MCFSAEASYTAAAILVPVGAVAMRRAYQLDRNYLPLATLPVLFGLQQLFEGFVWTAGHAGNQSAVETYSLAYMFFSWLAWPIWVPLSIYFIEPLRRRSVYLGFAAFGAVMGLLQYVPYFLHKGWLVTRFYDYAISYQGTNLLDFVMPREHSHPLYLFALITPLITSSIQNVRVFGALILAVVMTVYAFFSYAYISAFCFGGAVMSAFIVWMVFRETDEEHEQKLASRTPSGSAAPAAN